MLNREQQIAVNHFKGPMLVLAGPGSGKTRVLCERIRVLIEKYNVIPEEILVITFSKKAALEMKYRFNHLTKLNNYPVNFGTFHAVFYNILKESFNYSSSSIITERERLEYIKEIGINLNIDKSINLAWQKDMLSMISDYKNLGEEVFSANGYESLEHTDKEMFKKIYDLYIKKCQNDEKIDFDDMILLCKNLLYKHESLLRKWKERYRFILVDEFQDINNSQYEVLRLLAGDERNVFCVGDDDQSIYGFRGAKPEIMQKFLRQFYNCEQINLLVNYRCADLIVELSDKLIRHNVNRICRARQMVFEKNDKGLVEIIESESSLSQSNLVCNKIEELINDHKYKYSDFAVIYRSSHCAKMLEITCNNRNIPIDMRTTSFNIFDIREVRIIISYYRIACNCYDKTDILLIINNPKRNISREVFTKENNNYYENLKEYYLGNYDMLAIIEKLNNDIVFISKLPPYAAFIYILYGVGLYNYLKSSYRDDKYKYSFNELIEILGEIIREFDNTNDLIRYIQSSKNLDKESENNNTHRVHLITAHASKGLEYKVVFIIGLQEGLFPHKKNLHADNVEEERRLMYVAMTRAKEKLYLCTIGMDHGKQKSRFISEIFGNDYSSFISSNSSLSRNSSNASATASYSSSSSIYISSGSTLGSDSSSL